jgi:hypothetical protein
MDEPLRRLEQQVQAAADRLKSLRQERDRLREELREAQSAVSTERADATQRPDRAAVAAAVREAIAELRGH